MNTGVWSEDLPKLLKWRREMLGKSQNQLGAEASSGQATISRMEQGKGDVRLGTLIEVARALGMDVRIVPREVLPLVDDLITGVTHSATVREDDLPLYRLDDTNADTDD